MKRVLTSLNQINLFAITGVQQFSGVFRKEIENKCGLCSFRSRRTFHLSVY